MGTRCTIKINTLVSSIQERMNDSLRNWLTEHLDGGCDTCEQRIAWLTSLGQDGQNVTQVVAHSIPDVRLQSVPIALRGSLANVRQHLFEAGSDIRIDIQIEEITTLHGAPRECDTSEFVLTSPAGLNQALC